MARKGLFGRIFGAIKEVFTVETPKPTPKPTPKKIPTTRPARPQKSPAQIKVDEERMAARKNKLAREKKKRSDLVNKLEDLYGDRTNDYGDLTFNRANVQDRVRHMDMDLVNDLLDLESSDAIDSAYSDHQTEFSGYDQPQGFWYH